VDFSLSGIYNLAAENGFFGPAAALDVQLSQKYGADYERFKGAMAADTPEAKLIRDKLGAVFAPADAAADGQADPQLAILKKLDEAAAKNPDLFKQLGHVLLDDNGAMRPHAAEAVAAVADNPALRQKLLDAVNAPAGAGNDNLLASLEKYVTQTPDALQFVAQNPALAADYLALPDETKTQIGALTDRLNNSPLMAAMTQDNAGGADLKQQLGQNLIALVKKDPQAINKLNEILALPGSDRFLQLAATNDNLRNGFMKTLLSAGTDPDGSQNILDQIYDASKKHPTILQDTVDMAEKHPKLFDMASGLIGNNPGMAMQSIEMIGGVQNFLSGIPAGLRELLGKVLEFIAPTLDKLSDGMGTELANWIKPDASTTVISATNNQGDVTKAAGVVVDQTNDPNGNQVTADAATTMDNEMQRRIAAANMNGGMKVA
jgi:hypothetical protein